MVGDQRDRCLSAEIDISLVNYDWYVRMPRQQAGNFRKADGDACGRVGIREYDSTIAWSIFINAYA